MGFPSSFLSCGSSCSGCPAFLATSTRFSRSPQAAWSMTIAKKPWAKHGQSDILMTWVISHVPIFHITQPLDSIRYMGLSENRLNPYTQWFCWSLSLLNGYFIGGIPHFQTYPNVPMFHITQPLDSMIGINGLLDGYYFGWCPISPSHGTFNNPCMMSCLLLQVGIASRWWTIMA